MAKQFMDLAETARALRISEDQVRAMVKDGSLREYRDAGKVQYKSEDVGKLAAKEGSSIIDLAVSGEGSGDIGLSGSDVIALESPDDEPAKPGKGDTKITSVGISVFDDEELEIDADPLAKTSITPAMEDQVSLGGSGSGSGLLDLTRESDDTSLGAELLDVISPTDNVETETQTVAEAEVGETMTAPAGPEGAADDFAMDAGAPAVMVTMRTAPSDPSGPVFTGLMVASVIVLGLVGFVAASAMAGVWPDFLGMLAAGTNPFMYVLGGGFGVALIAALVGFMAGRSGAPRPAAVVAARKAPRGPKAKKQ